MLSKQYIFCVIPVFNNKSTIREVALGCREILPNVVVVDDGSTDADLPSMFMQTDIVVLRHERNQGKGRAILTGLRHVQQQKGIYMITIDADGQHFPQDIEKFLPFLDEKADALIVGARDFSRDEVPEKSRFGRNFAAFWLRVETSQSVDDCQSGFRAYPVHYTLQLNLTGKHYDFEAEVLAKAKWAGLKLKNVQVDVWYPGQGEKRITSFKPFLDNLRISHMHAKLVGRRLLPLPHKQLVKQEKSPEDIKQLLHPVKFLSYLLKENSSPGGLAAAAATGVFLGVLPLIAMHTVVILYVSTRLHLNKIMAVNAQHICMPPFVPALCIELGYYLRNGHFLTDISMQTIFVEFEHRLLEWLLGSLVVAPVLAGMIGFLTYITASWISNSSKDYEKTK